MLRSVLLSVTSVAVGTVLPAQDCIDTVQPAVTILSKEMLDAPDCLFTVRFCLRKTDGDADFIDYTVIHSYGAIVRTVGVANIPPGTVICQDFTFVAECDAHASFLAEARRQDTSLCGTVYAFASLPLRLLFFRGEVLDEGKVFLQWQTVREENASHFEVLESFDGKQFSPAALVEAKGKGDVPSTYHHIWSLPNDAVASEAFFRLKMIDRDGKHGYSPLLHLGLGERPVLTVYPVPASQQLCTSGLRTLYSEATAVDLLGRTTPLISSDDNCYDIRTLPSGFYRLQLGHRSIPFWVR